MTVKNAELKGEMARNGDTICMLSEALGITRQTLASRLSNRSEFRDFEVDMIIKRYDLTKDKATIIFGEQGGEVFDSKAGE